MGNGGTWKCVLCLVVLPFFAGCASYVAGMRQMDAALAAGDPAAALKALAPLDGGHDQALYLLDKAMILRMQGEYSASTDAFEKAKRLMYTLEATSVTETAAALTLSENLRSYEGALYERLLLHVYETLNYLQMGDTDDAGVEMRQVDVLLRRLYPDTDAAPQGGDAFARYLAGLMYEDAGDWSDAMIAYRKAYEAYQRDGVPDAAIPPGLQLSLCRFADHLGLDKERDEYRQRFGITQWPPVAPPGGDPDGQLVFIFSNGLAPAKIAVTQLAPYGNRTFSISLPALQRRPPLADAAVVSIDGQTVTTHQVENVAEDASRALAARMPKLIADEVARNVARNAAAHAADNRSRGTGALLSFIGAIVDRADTRIWNTLPDNIQMARLRLPPGTYTLKVSLDGRAAGSREFDDVTIRAGRITFAAWHAVTY
jgi:tetratricopeptide (TPR) repeat protein